MDTLLALSINGTPIPVPGGIKHITNVKVGFLGENLIQNIIVLLLILAVVLSLIYLIIGAIQWIASGGEKDALQSAKNKITYAIIGLVISFLSFFIITIVGNFFGVPLLGGDQHKTETCVATQGGDC